MDHLLGGGTLRTPQQLCFWGPTQLRKPPGSWRPGAQPTRVEAVAVTVDSCGELGLQVRGALVLSLWFPNQWPQGVGTGPLQRTMEKLLDYQAWKRSHWVHL